jgi:hypothetical protein
MFLQKAPQRTLENDLYAMENDLYAILPASVACAGSEKQYHLNKTLENQTHHWLFQGKDIWWSSLEAIQD